MRHTIYNELAHPPVAEHFLVRPAVVRLLRSAFRKPLTTVVAGAGYGKTQAVFAAIKALDCKSAWMQLSHLDNHIARFWERLSYTLAPQSRELSEGMLSLGFPETIAAFDQFLRLLAKELPPKEQFILVFDDFHFIQNPSVLHFIELFIAARLQNCSIVLISRTKPNLSLAELLSKGLLARITEDDLRFTKEEMAAYYQKQEISFSESTLSELYNHTAGWILAIYLIGLSAKQGELRDPVVSAKIDIFDLIEKEIFRTASKELQDFLVKTSVLDVIPSGLLKELADSDASLLPEMMQISLFRYDALYDGYRAHHFFKEFLQEKQHLLPSEAYRAVHLAAAAWFEKKGQLYDAIVHYKTCGCYDKVFDIILSVTRYVPKEIAETIIELIDEAPQEAVAARPIMKVARIRSLFNNNRMDEACRDLLALREEYEALPQSEEAQAILGEVYLLLGLVYVVRSDYEFVELFRKADACLPEGSVLINGSVNLGDGVNVCSIKEHSAGELKRHADALFETAPYATRVMNGCGYGMEYLNAAESSLYTGDMKAAEKHAYEAIYRAKQYQQYDIEFMANFVLVRIYTARGNYKWIMDILGAMKAQLDEQQIPDCAFLYDIICGWFYTKIGRTDQINKWIKHEEEARKILPPVMLGREFLVRSDCLLVEERYYELLALINQTDQLYEERGILFARIQNHITKAIVHHYMGDYVKSIAALHQAYELTHPNGLIMQYVEYGNRMRTLLHSARQNEACTIPREWLDMIYTKSSTYAKQNTQLVAAYCAANETEDSERPKLSKRETEVLEYLYRGMKREEIAASCYVSLSTINSTIKNIYDKLGAFNVADAVRIAKEKRIL